MFDHVFVIWDTPLFSRKGPPTNSPQQVLSRTRERIPVTQTMTKMNAALEFRTGCPVRSSAQEHRRVQHLRRSRHQGQDWTTLGTSCAAQLQLCVIGMRPQQSASQSCWVVAPRLFSYFLCGARCTHHTALTNTPCRYLLGVKASCRTLSLSLVIIISTIRCLA